MELSREHFGAESLSVLDQVAYLLYLSEQVLGLGRTFANNGDIAEANPDACIVVDFSRVASVGLMGALFHSPKNRRQALVAAYDGVRSGISFAIPAAERLSALEKRDTAGEGNVISGAVLPCLEQLRAALDAAGL